MSGDCGAAKQSQVTSCLGSCLGSNTISDSDFLKRFCDDSNVITHAYDVATTSPVLAKAKNTYKQISSSLTVDSALPVIVIEDAPINQVSCYSSVTIPETGQDLSHFHVPITLRGKRREVKLAAMVDSEATALFISRQYVLQNKMVQIPLAKLIQLYNIDGTLNKAELIAASVKLYMTVGDQIRLWEFLVMDIGTENVILGLPWLRHMNPNIDWETGEMKLLSKEDSLEWQPVAELTQINATQHMCRELLHAKVIQHGSDEVWCLASYTLSQKIAEQKEKAKGQRSFEDMVPCRYHKWRRIFSDEAV